MSLDEKTQLETIEHHVGLEKASDIARQIQEVTKAEASLSLIQAWKVYKKGLLWSVLVSSVSATADTPPGNQADIHSASSWSLTIQC